VAHVFRGGGLDARQHGPHVNSQSPPLQGRATAEALPCPALAMIQESLEAHYAHSVKNCAEKSGLVDEAVVDGVEGQFQAIGNA
jgi:hypothetical protein